jgi:CheY-like chemotaxis protein
MNEHILVVEDDEHLAAVLRDGLVQYGYALTLSATGTKALAAVQARPPALVILDLTLPDQKRSKMYGRCSGAMPLPVSRTTRRAHSWSASTHTSTLLWDTPHTRIWSSSISESVATDMAILLPRARFAAGRAFWRH